MFESVLMDFTYKLCIKAKCKIWVNKTESLQENLHIQNRSYLSSFDLRLWGLKKSPLCRGGRGESLRKSYRFYSSCLLAKELFAAGSRLLN